MHPPARIERTSREQHNISNGGGKNPRKIKGALLTEPPLSPAIASKTTKKISGGARVLELWGRVRVWDKLQD